MKKHKGGRTEYKSGFRLTPLELDLLNEELKKTGMSLSDWVVSKLETTLMISEV